jgi:hypothetical protein
MGMVTVVQISNDSFHEIKADPQRFVDEIAHNMNGGHLDEFAVPSRFHTKIMGAFHASETRAFISNQTGLYPADKYGQAQVIKAAARYGSDSEARQIERLLELSKEARRQILDAEKELKSRLSALKSRTTVSA